MLQSGRSALFALMQQKVIVRPSVAIGSFLVILRMQAVENTTIIIMFRLDIRNSDTLPVPYFLDTECRLLHNLGKSVHCAWQAGRMLVCSCNFISAKEIEDTIIGLLDEDCR